MNARQSTANEADESLPSAPEQNREQMNRIRKAMDERDQGFTLIELLVVMVIIGMLASIVIPVFLNQRKKAADTSMKSDLKSAATTFETLAVDNPTATGTQVTAADLTAAGWKHDSATDFKVFGELGRGNLCISAHNPAGTTTENSAEWVYVANDGGLQKAKGQGCIQEL